VTVLLTQFIIINGTVTVLLTQFIIITGTVTVLLTQFIIVTGTVTVLLTQFIIITVTVIIISITASPLYAERLATGSGAGSGMAGRAAAIPIQGLKKTPFLCPDGRVAMGAGRLVQ